MCVSCVVGGSDACVRAWPLLVRRWVLGESPRALLSFALAVQAPNSPVARVPRRCLPWPGPRGAIFRYDRASRFNARISTLHPLPPRVSRVRVENPTLARRVLRGRGDAGRERPEESLGDRVMVVWSFEYSQVCSRSRQHDRSQFHPSPPRNAKDRQDVQSHHRLRPHLRIRHALRPRHRRRDDQRGRVRAQEAHGLRRSPGSHQPHHRIPQRRGRHGERLHQHGERTRRRSSRSRSRSLLLKREKTRGLPKGEEGLFISLRRTAIALSAGPRVIKSTT